MLMQQFVFFRSICRIVNTLDVSGIDVRFTVEQTYSVVFPTKPTEDFELEITAQCMAYINLLFGTEKATSPLCLQAVPISTTPDRVLLINSDVFRHMSEKLQHNMMARMNRVKDYLLRVESGRYAHAQRQSISARDMGNADLRQQESIPFNPSSLFTADELDKQAKRIALINSSVAKTVQEMQSPNPLVGETIDDGQAVEDATAEPDSLASDKDGSDDIVDDTLTMDALMANYGFLRSDFLPVFMVMERFFAELNGEKPEEESPATPDELEAEDGATDSPVDEEGEEDDS